MAKEHHYVRTTLIGGVLVVLPLFVFANLLLWLGTWIAGKTAPVAEFVSRDLDVPMWVGQITDDRRDSARVFRARRDRQHPLRQSRVQLA